MKLISLLGATGSIGTSTLQVIKTHPDKLSLHAIAAHSNTARLLEITKQFPSIRHVAISAPSAAQTAKQNNTFPPHISLHSGPESLSTIATLPEIHTTLIAIVGTAGLQPALDTLRANKDLALASKEILVLAGNIITQTAKTSTSRLLPVDSEHNAVFQCLSGNSTDDIRRVTLTASGGAFRDWPLKQLAQATPADALKHPNWSMGPKITVDSATLANKGLELIEAQVLFNLPPEKLHAILHPQSIIHALVEYADGSTLAQLCPPSMTYPIQHALLHPTRATPSAPTLDLEKLSALNFAPIDESRYPMLRLAKQTMRSGPPASAIYNASNEVAVAAFLANKIPFLHIPKIVEQTLSAFSPKTPTTIPEILAIDAESRRLAQTFL